MKNSIKFTSFVLMLVMFVSSIGCFSTSAEEYTVPDTFMYGDVDFDGVVTVKDATLVQKYIAGLETLALLQKQAANINDSKITVRNATDIQKYIAQIEIKNSKVGETKMIVEPDKIKNVATLNEPATGDEIPFIQTERVVYNMDSESAIYFVSNGFYIFNESHYILNELDGTALEDKYTDKYFEDNALLVMSFGGASSSYMYRVDSLTKSDGVLGVNYTLLFPESGAVNADVVNNRLYIEVDKADIEGITDIVAYKNVELY